VLKIVMFGRIFFRRTGSHFAGKCSEGDGMIAVFGAFPTRA
jgi:hypothetical protein